MNVDLPGLFGRIPDTPAAVERLRMLVLQLAARGLFATQNPADEPAASMLDRVRAARPRGHRSVTSKPLARLGNDDLLAEAPPLWAWAALTEIGAFSGGMTPSKGRNDFWGGSINWFSAKDVKFDELFESELKITQAAVEQTRLRIYSPGSLVLVVRSGILKRTLPGTAPSRRRTGVAILREEGTVNQDLKVFTLQLMLRGFTPFILTSLVKDGTTVQSVQFARFESQLFPIPPLEEQHRIVERVDELMKLCDELQVTLVEREGLREKLLEAVFHEALGAKSS
jgi:type I restriction enzyme, S subunit